jgi:hypothetical protein
MTSHSTSLFKQNIACLIPVIHNLSQSKHSNTSDVCSFKGADCDTDLYLVLAKLRERISVSKRARQKFDLDRFDLKKLEDVEVKEKYQTETSNRFTGLRELR